jgi:hypothetical protein
VVSAVRIFVDEQIREFEIRIKYQPGSAGHCRAACSYFASDAEVFDFLVEKSFVGSHAMIKSGEANPVEKRYLFR